MDHNSINGQGQIDTYYQIILEKSPESDNNMQFTIFGNAKNFLSFFSFSGQSQISAVR